MSSFDSDSDSVNSDDVSDVSSSDSLNANVSHQRSRSKPQTESEPSDEHPVMSFKEFCRMYMYRKLSNALGSNFGGTYIGQDGIKRYIKMSNNPIQPFCEHLANLIYRDNGIPAPKSQIVKFQNKTRVANAYMSEYIEDLEPFNPRSQKETDLFLKGMVWDMLLGNHDVLGMDYDNVAVLKKNGKVQMVIRIDNGSALLTRARGDLKSGEILFNLTEWSNFFDPDFNENYARVLKTSHVYFACDFKQNLISQRDQVVERLSQFNAGSFTKYIEYLIGDSNKNFVSYFDIITMTHSLNQKLEILNKSLQECFDKGPTDIDEAQNWVYGYISENFTRRFKLLPHIPSKVGELYPPLKPSYTLYRFYSFRDLQAKRAWSDSEVKHAKIATAVIHTSTITSWSIDPELDFAPFEDYKLKLKVTVPSSQVFADFTTVNAAESEVVLLPGHYRVEIVEDTSYPLEKSFEFMGGHNYF